ncbi:hypothetical protein CcaCcLH18_07635 [Colletotrichum camelliae]|nr:hypothetical protein CcaCcLH18_07635 [Colletotrichum camelliae]
MSCPVEEIIKHYEYDPTIIQRIAKRKTKLPLAIEPPNPAWPEHFEFLKSRIIGAIGPTAVTISHVGSTSVPNLPAKAVIDIDLAIANPTAEDEYAPALEAAGFQFLIREPEWHEHRFFAMSEPYHCNLHVFKVGTAEMARHLIMKEWLTAHEDDKELYARAKFDAAGVSNGLGETVMEYNLRKENVIREILERAFRAKGLHSADISYATAAKIAIKLMMSHELGQYRLQGMETCALCEGDDSVDEEKKRHVYTVGHLREHVASDFHTPYKQWIRRTHQDRDARMAADPNDRDFTWPYCLEAADDSETFKAMKKLTLHILRSNSTNIAGKNDWTTPENSAKHDKLKAEAGWYEENWQVNTSEDVKRGTTHRKRKFEQPVPVPGQSGIVWAQPSQVVGEHLENPGPSITFGAAPGSSGYKPSIKPIPGVITIAPPPGSPGWKPTFTKPPRGAYYVARPGTSGNMPGDGHLISDRLKDRHK